MLLPVFHGSCSSRPALPGHLFSAAAYLLKPLPEPFPLDIMNYNIYVQIFQYGKFYKYVRIFFATCICAHLQKRDILATEVIVLQYNESSYKASQKYRAAKIKRIPLDVQVTDYDKIKTHANERGESVNGFIKRAIGNQIAQDKEEEKTED